MKNKRLFLNKENQKIRNITSPEHKKSLQAILNDIPLQVNNKIFIHHDNELETNPKKNPPRRQTSLIPMRNANARNLDSSKDCSMNEKMNKEKMILEKTQSQKNNRNMILIRKVKSPKPNFCTLKNNFFFYNEIQLVKINKEKQRNFKKLAVLHFESLGQIIKKKNGKASFFLTMEFDEFLEYMMSFCVVVIIISEGEYNKDIFELLNQRGGHYHLLYQIKQNKSLMKEGNIVLNYSSLFKEILYEMIEEVIVLQNYNIESFKTNINDLKFLRCFENKLIYFENLENKKLKICYLDENSFHKAKILTLFKENSFDSVPLLSFKQIFSFYKEKFLEKSNNIEMMQTIHAYKRTLPPNIPKNLEEIYTKNQIQIRKAFFDYLIELKKYPRMKNLLIGPVIDSLLERNSHIFKHILKNELEKETSMKKIFDFFTKFQNSSETAPQKKEIKDIENYEKFLNLYYHNNPSII